MPIPSWPSTIPQKLLISGYQQSASNVLLRTESDTGPAMVRRRMTAGVQKLSGSQILTFTELGYLRTFYNTTLIGGSLRFSWVDPITNSSVEMRFVEPISWSAVSGDKVNVSMSLEILP